MLLFMALKLSGGQEIEKRKGNKRAEEKGAFGKAKTENGILATA